MSQAAHVGARSGLVMVDIAGTTLDDSDRALLAHPSVGGLILFSRNVRTPEQVRALTEAIRAERPELLIAVDQEGGRVQRLREGFTRLPPMAALGRRYDDDPDAAMSDAHLLGQLMADEVMACGIDISFAPVLDMDYGRSKVMGDRCFHDTAEGVIALAGAFSAGMQWRGMSATGKHFPGHGYAEADSHHALPRDERDLTSLRATDLVPFSRLAAQLDGIMPAHILYPAVDQQPAGFSRIWLQDILRGELGFAGVIFSDDLAMAGAAFAGGYAARARAALEAGCDMVLVCNDRNGANEVLRYLDSLDSGNEKLSLPGTPVRATTLRAREGHRLTPTERRDAEALAGALCEEAIV